MSAASETGLRTALIGLGFRSMAWSRACAHNQYYVKWEGSDALVRAGIFCSGRTRGAGIGRVAASRRLRNGAQSGLSGRPAGPITDSGVEGGGSEGLLLECFVVRGADDFDLLFSFSGGGVPFIRVEAEFREPIEPEPSANSTTRCCDRLHGRWLRPIPTPSPLRFTFRHTVDGDRFSRRAIDRNDSPAATLREISSRSPATNAAEKDLSFLGAACVVIKPADHDPLVEGM